MAFILQNSVCKSEGPNSHWKGVVDFQQGFWPLIGRAILEYSSHRYQINITQQEIYTLVIIKTITLMSDMVFLPAITKLCDTQAVMKPGLLLFNKFGAES